MTTNDDRDFVDATVAEIIRVVEQMTDLPWPRSGAGWVEWQIDGLDGQSSYLAHVLPLAGSDDERAVARLVDDVRRAADRRWRAHRSFDATRHTDAGGPSDAKEQAYDPRRSAAKLIRAIGAGTVPLWELADHDVVLADGSAPGSGSHAVAVLVLPGSLLTSGRARPKPSTVRRPDEALLKATTAAAQENELVADLVSGDSSRIMSASWAIIHTRDPAVLAPPTAYRRLIQQSTEDVELGGALASNGAHLVHALERLAMFEKQTCLCAAYPSHLFYEPAKEEARGHVRIVEETPTFYNGRPDRPERICACIDCGQRFSVEEGESHYTWWKWTTMRAGDQSSGPAPS